MLRLVLILVLTYPTIVYSSASLQISDDGSSVTLVKNETHELRETNAPINTTSGQFANITVDGNISDWANIPALITDPVGDSTDIDIKTLKVANDENFIYFLEEFTNPLNNYTSLQLDTDLNSATGCTATAGMGIEYGIAINAETAFIGDARDCSWGIEDFPNAFVTVVSGNFVEASIPITVLQNISPEFTGFNISVSNDTEIARYMLASNETPNAGSLQFSLSNYSVNEAGASVTITVSRTNGSDGAVSVDYATNNGTATSGNDYLDDSATLNWNDGDNSNKTISINIIDDNDSEANETFNLTLSNATGGATIGSRNTTVVTIFDNDAGEDDCPHASFSVADQKITIPMLDMPLLDSMTGEPNGNMAVLKADLQMTEGVGDFKMIPESISVLSDVEPNNECHASFSYETRIMHLPFVDVSSTIMLPPNIVIDGPIQVFKANLQQLQLYNEIYHLKDYNFLYNLEGE
jgi:hypothetical protein